ncbi:MAG TPA: site-specific DNA-methyltransferase [Solirubrobacterales bacterium]|nr:site-specific DNA-methyltransferase [Solirubrobacterales bacterium]
MPASSVHCCVTSPPYFGLRDYGVAPRIWGGAGDCRHRWKSDGRCRTCDAWRGCLGLEPEVGLYVRNLVAVMREVKRVLRDDGSLWLVIGDSFTTGRCRRGSASKPKDLLGVPWRVALALQDDGWWLRSDIVWQKPDAMPESVRDRPTRSHEFVFLLTKRSSYFYDAEAVREPDKGGGHGGNGYVRSERLTYGGRGQKRGWVGGSGRNRRSVWTIATACFKGAHFATFPDALVEPCLLAGSSPTACEICGAPWRRLVDSRRLLDGKHELKGGWTSADPLDSGRAIEATGFGHWRVEVRRHTVGWEATCSHDAPGGRCRVLDPFAGVGTTGVVAARHGRDFLGVELSPKFATLARERVRGACTGSRSGGKIGDRRG